MQAIAKTHVGPGFEMIDVPEPTVQPGTVKIRVERASICGTDLHIYNWDEWSSGRIKPPRIVGHEFCGTIVEIGEGVVGREIGEFISSECRVTCGKCIQCLNGQAHLCQNLKIIGVDVDGGFAPYAVIPSKNAVQTPSSIPHDIACMQDAIGNAVHTVMAGPVKGKSILITGLGPQGLFAGAICKSLGASQIVALEVSPFRKNIGEKLNFGTILDPTENNIASHLQSLAPLGLDAGLEMSGHTSSFNLLIHHVRPGGRLSLLGISPNNLENIDINTVVLHGLEVQGISGRILWETWNQMHHLLVEEGLNLSPVVTHHFNYRKIEEAIQLLKAGQAGKIVLDFS